LSVIVLCLPIRNPLSEKFSSLRFRIQVGEQLRQPEKSRHVKP
jgi:hypothetical protein